MFCFFYQQNVDESNSYLCGYLMIKGLTEEYPTLTTFFDGEIISEKYPFLTRKWEADEDIDRLVDFFAINFIYLNFILCTENIGTVSKVLHNIRKILIVIISIINNWKILIMFS